MEPAELHLIPASKMSANDSLQDTATIGYLDALDDLLRDCRSGDPTKRPFCIGATVLGALGIFFVPVIVFFGVIGNTLTTYVMLSEQRLKCRQNLYLALIAVSDSGNLISWGLGWQIVAKGLPWISRGTVGFFMVNVSDLACRLFRFVHNFFHVLSANWFLLMTLDRVLTLHYPFKFRTLTNRSAWKALLVVLLISLILVAPVPVFTGWYILDNKIACLAVPFFGQGVRIWTIIRNALFMIPPMVQLLAISIVNLFLLRKVLKILRNRKSMANSGEKDKESDEIGPSIVVLFLSLVYFLSGMPPCIAQYIVLQLTVFSPTTDQNMLRTVLNLGDVGQIMLLFNQSINWIILVWKNKLFRARFVRALTCGLVKARLPTSVYGSGTSLQSAASTVRHRGPAGSGDGGPAGAPANSENAV